MNTKMRIKSADEFNDIIKTGTKIYSPFFIIYYKEKKLDNPRFGITQAKKFGKAYKRNRYRRILREIIRTNIKVFKNEYDYIIIIMKKCDTLDFKQIEDNLLKVIKEKL
ncbi:MAG: ribonuclease P protein component [Bacilli bacterium]|nr:ribonuclease P protein component [Bacilli bacterium]MCI6932862.1 ribonuclease P protein component [Mycoplasmatota bacterium]